MLLDSQLNFVSYAGAAQSMVAGAGVAVVLGDVKDLLGQGAGTAPANIIGNATVFGEDPGIGRIRPVIQITIGTAFTTGNSATANFALQYAADAGSPTYQPGTWETATETGAKAVSEMTANQVLKLDWAAAPPNVQRPRFVRLVMLVPAGTNLSAGTVSFAGLTMARDDQAQKNQGKNYSVS